jgi:hypothetical protein
MLKKERKAKNVFKEWNTARGEKEGALFSFIMSVGAM